MFNWVFRGRRPGHTNLELNQGRPEQDEALDATTLSTTDVTEAESGTDHGSLISLTPHEKAMLYRKDDFI